MQGEQGVRARLVETCRSMYEQGYIVATDGNASARLGDDRIAVTPSGVHKGFLKPADLVITDLDGGALHGGRPTSEMRMHIEVYRRRPDVGAVLHAHPPHTLALSVAGISLGKCILPETVFSLGRIEHAGYATPTTDDVPRAIALRIADHDALILDRHGTLTVGADLRSAFNRLEQVEHTAKVSHLAHLLGPVAPLPPEEVERIHRLAEGLGSGRSFEGCGDCSVCRRER